MKKLFALILAIALILSLAACGGQSEAIIPTNTEDSFFDCTEAQIIEAVNLAAEKAGAEAVCFNGPETNGWYKSDKTTYFHFKTNDNEKVTEIAFCWTNAGYGTKVDALSAGFVVGIMPKLFGLDDLNLSEIFPVTDPLDFYTDAKVYPPVEISFVALNGSCRLTITPSILDA